MNTRSLRIIFLLAVLTAASAPGAGALGAGAVPGLEGWAVYGGAYDTAGDRRPFEAGVEYRFRALKVPKVALKPAVGVAGTEDGNAWVYGGLRLDLALGSWIVTPQFAAAVYEQGDGKDLGGPIEFRSGLEVAYRFAGGTRLGVLFYHLSNGDFYDFNPGSNSLVLTWSFGR